MHTEPGGAVQGERDLGIGAGQSVGCQVKLAPPVRERAVAGQREREVARSGGP